MLGWYPSAASRCSTSIDPSGTACATVVESASSPRSPYWVKASPIAPAPSSPRKIRLPTGFPRVSGTHSSSSPIQCLYAPWVTETCPRLAPPGPPLGDGHLGGQLLGFGGVREVAG